MKYIIGYTHREYAVGGVLIPKKVYTSEEKARGKKEFTAVEEETVDLLRKDKIFNALETQKKLRVLDQIPGWAKTSADREKELLNKIKTLESNEQLSELKNENEQIKAQAQEIIDGLRKEIEELKNKE